MEQPRASDIFEVSEIQTEEEYQRLNPVLWEAAHSPYHPVFSALHPVRGFAAADREESIRADGAQKWAQHKRNPASHWVHVIERATDRVVAGGEWLIFTQNPFPNGPKPITCSWFPEDSETQQYVSDMLSQIFWPRQCWLPRAHAGVNSMGVLPAYRRRGIASLMMKWGHDRVDELGLESFIEAHSMGRWLYESFGYRRLMDISANMERKAPSDNWKRLMHDLEPPHDVSLLWRPVKGKWKQDGPRGPWELL